MRRVILTILAMYLLSSSTLAASANVQIQIGLTPTPAPTDTPDESYKENNRYVDPELGWSISWSDDDDWEALASEGRFILRQQEARPEIYVWIMNIEPRSSSGSISDRLQTCVVNGGSSDDGAEVLDAPNGDLLMEVNETEGWAVYGYTNNFGPHALYVHCWAITGKTDLVLFRAEVGTPQDFNKRSHIIQELVASFKLPGE